MHKDDIDLARRLFATAMAKLEDATIIASRGQPVAITREIIVREANALRSVAHDVVAIADATLAVTHRIDTCLRRKKRKFG